MGMAPLLDSPSPFNWTNVAVPPGFKNIGTIRL
jgi:hypothetical protein